MILNQKVVVTLPAYNAGMTLERTVAQIPQDIVDELVLVDDCSSDNTVAVAERLGIAHIEVHGTNRGYGANQKTCYRTALDRGADIIIMLHPDYQYDPRLVGAMAAMIASGIYGLVLGSRILGSGTTGAIGGGMPLYKYIANRGLTAIQNLALRAKLSEYHTGFRAYSRDVLESLPILANSDDFVFDNQLLVQAIGAKVSIGEVSCPTRYLSDSSSISFRRSVRYGFGVLSATLGFVLWKLGASTPRFLEFRECDTLKAVRTRGST
jgi:glycosyltransferase involved in cell wall biosynthesis